MKEEAFRLREQGKTYKEIVQILGGGVSLDWCKRNLKGVLKRGDNSACIAELELLASRPEGITEYEATGIIFKHFENATPNKVRYIKRVIKKNPKLLVRPDWSDTEHPTESYRSIMALSVHLADEVGWLVEDFMTRYPKANPWAVKHEILKLAFSNKISQEPLTNRIHRNELVIEAMEERLEVHSSTVE